MKTKPECLGEFMNHWRCPKCRVRVRCRQLMKQLEEQA